MKNLLERKVYALVICLCIFGCFKRHPTNANALLHQKACIDALELVDYGRATTHCELCLEYDASMPECLNGLGLIALLNHNEEKAKDFFSRALRQDNNFSQARNNLGVIYFNRGDYTSSLSYFERALEIDPSNVDARYNAALSHLRLGQKWRAQNDLKKSYHHFKRGEEQAKKLIALDEKYPNALRDLGFIILSLNDLAEFEAKKPLASEAKSIFNRCIKMEDTNDGCYEGLGQIFFEEGMFRESFNNYFLCLGHAPDNSACRSGIVMAYEKSAHFDRGYQAFKDAATKMSQPLAHEAFCAALFERGLYGEAVLECEYALRLKPDLCRIHYRLADYFNTVKRSKNAVEHCQAYLSCPKNANDLEIKKCQEILANVQH